MANSESTYKMLKAAENAINQASTYSATQGDKSAESWANGIFSALNALHEINQRLAHLEQEMTR